MAELPYMQFFPADWLADTRMMTASAKGVWIDTLADLWSAPERGLRTASEREWARLWGVEPERVPDLVGELSKVAGIRREKAGNEYRVTIYSRRIIRDELERERSRNSKRAEDRKDWTFRKSMIRQAPELFPDLSRNIPADFPEDSRTIPGDILETRDQSKEREGGGAKKPTRKPPADDPLVIVQSYPRREKTSEALAIVAKQLADGEDYEAMLAGTRAAAAVIRTLPSGHLNRYVPSAEKFFRDLRWKDDPETLRRQGNQSNGQAKIGDDEIDRMLGRRANPNPETEEI